MHKGLPMTAPDRARPAKDLLETLFRRLRKLARISARSVEPCFAADPDTLIELCQQLLEERSQSSGVHLAGDILGAYGQLDDTGKQ